MLSTKAEMGIGTLIIFIALLLVAAIAAGVLIQTSGSLQEKSLTTGQQARGQVATNTKVVEVSGTDGSLGYINNIQMIVKLSPGSDNIKLDDTIFTLNTFDKTSTLQYRGPNGTFENTNEGYNTWTVESIPVSTTKISLNNPYSLAEDYDDDGVDDYLTVDTTGTIIFNFSSGTDYSVPFASANCDAENNTWNVEVIPDNEYISSVLLNITCGGDAIYASNITALDITPLQLGNGYFTVEYLQRGSNPIAGNLQRGDVIKIYLEAPKSIGEDEKVRINFIPKIGTPTLTEFITPEVISTERVYLYP